MDYNSDPVWNMLSYLPDWAPFHTLHHIKVNINQEFGSVTFCCADPDLLDTDPPENVKA